jgi:2-phosphoglycerate kinase
VDANILERLGRIGGDLMDRPPGAGRWSALVQGAVELTQVEVGILFKVADEELIPVAVLLDGEPLGPGSEAWYALCLPQPDAGARSLGPAWHSARHGVTVQIDDLSQAGDFDLDALRAWDRVTGRASRSLLCIPICYHRGVSAVLQLLDARQAGTSEVGPFAPATRLLGETLAWQAGGRLLTAGAGDAPPVGVTVIKGFGVTRRVDAPLLVQRLRVAGVPERDAASITEEVFAHLFAEGLDAVADEALEARICAVIEDRLGRKTSDRFHAWSSFRRSGQPLSILIGGCSGSGKSTLAADLGLLLDIGRVQSTDTLREVMRLLVSEHLAPELHCSTYEAWKTLPRLAPDLDAEERLIAGFEAQADKVAVAVRGLVQRNREERESAILEGAHLHPTLCRALDEEGGVTVSLLVAVPEKDGLARHFQWRALLAPSRKGRRHMDQFDAIWSLQRHLLDQAAAQDIPVIPNVGLEFCMHQALEVISRVLVQRFPPP